MMDDIEVTVVIITYMHEKYIRKCLDSVFSQKTTFKYYVVVAEDASPDDTRKILLEYKKKFKDQLTLVLHDQNVGPAKNVVSTYPYLKGKYVASVEGDDYWTDDQKLQKQYEILERNPSYSAVACDNITVYDNGKIASLSNLALKKDITKDMSSWMKEGFSIHGCTIFYRNDIIPHDDKTIKLLTFYPTMTDLIVFTLLYDYGCIYVIKDAMAAHRLSGKEDVSSFSFNQKDKSIYYTKMFIGQMKNLELYFDNKYDFTPRICNRIASVKFNKLRKKYNYDPKEMREIMNSLEIKWRIEVYRRLLVKMIKAVGIKFRRIKEKHSA